MDSIVADYSSSTESEEDNTRDFENENNLLKVGLFGCTAESDEELLETANSSKEDENVNLNNRNDIVKLPKPSFNSTWDELSGVSNGVSVFANPFRAAEEAQKSLLEKHVKMTAAPKQTQVINGKQVCWNYRKGRCRFGHNCKFAHDSDLPAPVKKPEIETFEKQLETSNVIIGKPVRQKQTSIAETTSDDEDKQYVSKKKRKCGLGDSLIPSKKVIKMYNRQTKEM